VSSANLKKEDISDGSCILVIKHKNKKHKTGGQAGCRGRRRGPLQATQSPNHVYTSSINPYINKTYNFNNKLSNVIKKHVSLEKQKK
jgi:hypothetical protein